MENYINICGQRIELTAEQVEQLKSGLGLNQVRLADIAVKDTFKIGQHEFVVLEHSGDTTAVIRKDLLVERKEFGENNNYAGSYVEEICNQFGAEIEAVIGKENLVEYTVDLTSDDGLKDYGNIRRRVSLLTADLYRRYVEVLDEHKPDKWWWLATPYSTPKHENDSWVKCVAPSGYVNYYYCDYGRGVRPFCILKSNIFVSK
ncbi:MAG: hypothetical protein IJA11_08650 [Oscillospiraceae bacterium]|nr:hypothetical protein [Oscillospiraceae bacterium]